MSWFVFALVATLGWGCADLFYKKGTDENDRYSHLKIAVTVGLVMGVCGFALLPFSETKFSLCGLLLNTFKYLPASAGYILSMVIGYVGLRYLEVSIVSPIQNASGALSTVAMSIYFLAAGKIKNIKNEFSALELYGTVIIVVGVIALAIVEQRCSAIENKNSDRRYKYGALALLFPILYCVFDTLGTAADGVILDSETGLGLGEIDVIIVYGLTFFVAGIIAYIYIWIKEGNFYNPFSKKERPKMTAAVCEEFGQVFYVYAMAKKPLLAAPMIASYCIVSVILSRIFIKEKLNLSKYLCILPVILGIVLLGISEGING